MLRNKDTKFGAYIRRRHYTSVDCMMHVAHDDTLLEYINDHSALGHQLGLDFTLLRIVSTDRGHKHSWPHVLEAQKRRSRGRAGHDCVADQCSFPQLVD